ncbi:MAG: long-chain fatty acid--CoA ligase [Halobacteriota archaeon]|nr:long-chain fatty acid--CoA ligase [Halobacteriota archaeon]
MSKIWLKNYPEGVPEHIDYPNITMYQLFEERANRWSENTSLIFMGKKMTYAELKEKIDTFSYALHELGIKKGDKVAILMPNCPQVVISYLATLRLGAMVVMCNPMYTEDELVHQLNDSETETVITLDMVMTYPKIENLKDRTKIKRVIVSDLKEYLPFMLSILFPLARRSELVKVEKGPGIYFFKDLLKEYKDLSSSPIDVDIDPNEDVALLQYTGGTTGLSKAAMLTHKNIISNALQARSWFVNGVDGEEVCMGALPFFHVYGMTIAMNVSLALGGSIVLMPDPRDIKTLLKGISKYKVTIFPGVPTMYVAINNFPGVEGYNLSTIKSCLSGAAPLPLEVIQKFEKITGGKLVEGYGLTESSPLTHANPLVGKVKIGSIGVAVPDTEMKIVDLLEGEEEQPVGSEGELIIKGPQVMKGYWKSPDDTRVALRDGWLYTGDIAKMDEDGYTYIVDRKKDMIIAGGYNIYPRDIDEVLFEHPKVLKACAVGIPDQYRGESLKAFVVLKAGEFATEQEIIDFCSERLAKYKVPKSVEFRDELPETMVGKVLRRALREEEIEKGG